MKTDKATARPWKTRFNQSTNKPSLEIETREKYNQTILYFSNGQMAEENAELIVRAVNSHDALVEAISDLLLAIDCNEEGSFLNLQYIADEMATAKEALKQAKGGEA